jgi:hypothetical protein
MTATVSAASLSHIIVSPLFFAGPQLGALAAEYAFTANGFETHIHGHLLVGFPLVRRPA